LFVLKLRKVQTKDTSFFALKIEKSGLRTAAKPLESPFFQENALFLLKKHEIAAFVLVDKSGYFYGASDQKRYLPEVRGFKTRDTVLFSILCSRRCQLPAVNRKCSDCSI
jgi:hypothetical protein